MLIVFIEEISFIRLGLNSLSYINIDTAVPTG